MRIALIRHAPVEFCASRWVSPSEVRDEVSKYNVAPLISTKVPQEVEGLAHSASIFVASSLTRSVRTAQLLAHGRDIVIDNIYDEAALPAPRWPFPLLPVCVWFFVLRVLWLMRLAGGAEPKASAQLRAQVAAQRLVKASESETLTLLVGHGIFMAFISRELEGMGWRRLGSLPKRPWSSCCYLPPN